MNQYTIVLYWMDSGDTSAYWVDATDPEEAKRVAGRELVMGLEPAKIIAVFEGHLENLMNCSAEDLFEYVE